MIGLWLLLGLSMAAEERRSSAATYDVPVVHVAEVARGWVSDHAL